MNNYLPTESVPYGKELETIKQGLKKVIHSFPFGDCAFASRILEIGLDLTKVKGYYSHKDVEHAWNYDPNIKLWLDLTLSQFDSEIPEIVILSSEDKILHPTQFMPKGLPLRIDQGMLESRGLKRFGTLEKFVEALKEEKLD